MRPPGASRPPDRRPAVRADVGVARETGRQDSIPEEPRQRWRIVFRRAAEPVRAQREDLQAWEAALVASELPIAGLERPGGRPRFVVGAALAVGMPAERELLDIFLTRRLSLLAVREAIEGCLPAGHVLVDLYDVWLGAPPLPAVVVAAEYRVQLGPGAPAGSEVADAARLLLDARSLPRERTKGGSAVQFDLRPLVEDVRVVDPDPPVTLWIRTRFDPQLGTGRPAEVLEALGDLLGAQLPVEALTRERLVLAGEG